MNVETGSARRVPKGPAQPTVITDRAVTTRRRVTGEAFARDPRSS